MLLQVWWGLQHMDPTLDVPFILKKKKQKSTQLKTDQKMDSHGIGFPKLH